MTKTDYAELIAALREAPDDWPDKELHFKAANAIEDLQDKVDRAIGFWNTKEDAEFSRRLNKLLPDITSPEWQKAHMDMGFYSPLGEIYKETGLYDCLQDGTENQT